MTAIITTNVCNKSYFRSLNADITAIDHETIEVSLECPDMETANSYIDKYEKKK